MVRREVNPFAEKQRRLPCRAYINRDEPWRSADHEEIEAACRHIANGAEYLIWAGSSGLELDCTVIGFDISKKASEMQVWIDTSDIADRPAPLSGRGARR
jgi:hypothetical protein